MIEYPPKPVPEEPLEGLESARARLMYVSLEAEAELLSKAQAKDWGVLWKRMRKAMPTPFINGYGWSTCGYVSAESQGK